MSALKALRALDRFTIGRLAAAAGVRAATLRPLLLRWKEMGFPLLEEAGIERSPAVGQPPKLYVLAAGMRPVVEASIQAAEHLSVPPSERSGQISEAIDRMNLLDTAKELIDGAERTADSAERAKLVGEAGRLLSRCRVILQRRIAAGRGGASTALQHDLLTTEQRIARITEKLRIIIEHCAIEIQKNRPEEWLSIEAKHYLASESSGDDAEVGFFGGVLVARGMLSETQDTVLDAWLSKIAAPSRDSRDRPDLPWEALQGKFTTAFGRIVECGCRDESWQPLLNSCLAGVIKNARLAVVREIHEHIAVLLRNTLSETLRRRAQLFLEQYSLDAFLMVRDVLPTENADIGFAIDPYFLSRRRVVAPHPVPQPSDSDTREDNEFKALMVSFETLFGRRSVLAETTV